jgi:cytochrome c-type biogenesis protein
MQERKMLTETVSYSAALLAGLLSFLSPCILPLIPAYFTFITGLSLEELTSGDAKIRKRVVISTISYVLGFSFVFILMGATASFLGNVLFKYRDIVRIMGGVFIVVLGIHLTGAVRIKLLDVEKRIHPEHKPLHALGTFVVGMAFGAGWSPCIGPMLGSILILAGNQETIREGMLLLGVYAAGLAVPFIGISFFIHYFLNVIRKAKNALHYVHMLAGVLLIVVGLLLIVDKLNLLNVSG